MEDLKLKILKTSETGKKLIELCKKADIHLNSSKALANELGFQDAWVEGREFRGRVIGFSEPNADVNLNKYCKINKYGFYKPRVSQKEIWEKMDKIGIIECEEIDRIIGIKLQVFQRIGFEMLDDVFIITIDKSWKKYLEDNKDIQEIKLSEYYKMKGE